MLPNFANIAKNHGFSKHLSLFETPIISIDKTNHFGLLIKLIHKLKETIQLSINLCELLF